MTRHKLDIPEEFLPILSDAHRAINGKEVKVIQYYGDYCFVNSDEHSSVFNHAKVFVSWLTEIKEEPWRKYFDETYKYCSKGKKTDGVYLDIKEAFQAGEQNNELRHRETKTEEEIFSALSSEHDLIECNSDYVNASVWFGMGWQACKESHNIK